MLDKLYFIIYIKHPLNGNIKLIQRILVKIIYWPLGISKIRNIEIKIKLYKIIYYKIYTSFILIIKYYILKDL